MDAITPWEMADPRAIAYLRSPTAIRRQCGRLFALAEADHLPYFRCHLDQLERVADYVLAVITDQYPDGAIPFHSRWRHFEVGGVDRLAHLRQQLVGVSAVERARILFDLVIPSVLLDAGAGDRWQYREATTGQVWGRSEGLAVASFHLFCQGEFSGDLQQPLRTDAAALGTLSESALAAGFQVTEANPLVGLAGRVSLLHKLGQTLAAYPHLCGDQEPRPGHLVDYLLTQVKEGCLPAPTVLAAVLEGLSPIWPGRITLGGVNLGDVWPHPSLAGEEMTDCLVPFHKLSQWLTYSLLEPLQELGLKITGLDQLTGLPEYRNGGLCLDLGLLEVKDPSVLSYPHPPDAPLIVEWRALTVVLLDRIAATLRQKLHQTEEELPLVKVLQGGTWTAGRRIAAEKRSGGISPIAIASDGTVF